MMFESPNCYVYVMIRQDIPSLGCVRRQSILVLQPSCRKNLKDFLLGKGTENVKDPFPDAKNLTPRKGNRSFDRYRLTREGYII